MSDALQSWNDTPARQAIVEFVERTTREGGPTTFRPPTGSRCSTTTARSGARSRCRSSSGSSCTGSPTCARPIASLRDRQPWKAAYERDYAWLGEVITKHYHGDDTDVKVLMGGILRAFGGMTVEAYEQIASEFLSGPHPTLSRSYRECGYLPMIELLRYLEANGFTAFIASGGDRDFMRPVTEEIYGIPAERVIGSSNALQLSGGRTRGHARVPGETRRVRRRADQAGANLEPRRAAPDRRGRQLQRRHPDAPLLARPDRTSAFGCSSLHDDPDREFDYTAGAEQSLERAKTDGWTVVSIKNDWAAVFPEPYTTDA